MRFTVLATESLAPGISRIRVEAPRVARFAQAGQFVIVRADGDGERIPLTICSHDPAAGSIVLVVQAVGASTAALCAKEAGDTLADVLGPLGHPTETGPYGHVVTVGGGVGAAIALPVTAAMRAAGNRVTAIVGARTEQQLILLDEMTAGADRVVIATDDGSAGRAGLVTDVLGDELDAGPVDRVFVAGPVAMMAAVAATTSPYDVPTVASLNPIMVDGTGMCGGCRVRVAGEVRFACVDGPEFDAHAVDFALLGTRNAAYRAFERCRALEP